MNERKAEGTAMDRPAMRGDLAMPVRAGDWIWRLYLVQQNLQRGDFVHRLSRLRSFRMFFGGSSLIIRFSLRTPQRLISIAS